MRRLATVGVICGFALLWAAASASAQGWGRPPSPSSGACFYENPDFGGRYFCDRMGASRATIPIAANDRISSIRVFGDVQVVVFRDGDFRGQSRVFDDDIRDLRRAGFNDRISSFRIERRGYGQGGWGSGGGYGDRRDDWQPNWGRDDRPQSGACFYEDPDYRGRYFCARVGNSSGRMPPGTNDKISSIQIFGNAEVTVFRDGAFEGSSSRFDSDMPDLRRYGWNDRISSFRVENRRGWGSGRGQSNGRQVTRREAEEIVRRAYLAVLEREPDPSSRSWVDEVMKNNLSQRQVEDELRKSPEYRQKIRRRR